MRWVLDVCAGFGGLSEAFVKDPSWRVVRIEKDAKLTPVEHTRFLDAFEWMDWLPNLIQEMGCGPDLIIAGPDCLDFSQAYNAPKSRAVRDGTMFEPNMDLLEACIDIIQYCNPAFHIVENVVGSKAHFLNHIQFKQKVGSHLFYGNFPHLKTACSWVPSKKDSIAGNSLFSYQKRSRADIEVSNAILDAVTSQTQLFREWA